MSSSGNQSGSDDRLNESDHQLLQEKASQAYVPVALVICTEIENHDLFRSMLEELFESIRKPEHVTDTLVANKKLAYADMLAHLAYLKTLPCPSFNTKMNIGFYNKQFIVNEQEYFNIP